MIYRPPGPWVGTCLVRLMFRPIRLLPRLVGFLLTSLDVVLIDLAHHDTFLRDPHRPVSGSATKARS